MTWHLRILLMIIMMTRQRNMNTLHVIYIRKCVMSVCMRAMAGRTAGPIKTKLGIGTRVDPVSVLGKVVVVVVAQQLFSSHPLTSAIQV